MSNKQSWIKQHIDKLSSSENKFKRISLDGRSLPTSVSGRFLTPILELFLSII